MVKSLKYICFSLLFLNASGFTLAAEPQSLRFWNTEAAAIIELSLAPVGSTAWSANFCALDPDHEVDPDERLPLPGVAPGHYDVRVVDAKVRRCIFHNVTVSGVGHYAFALSERQMASCR